MGSRNGKIGIYKGSWKVLYETRTAFPMDLVKNSTIFPIQPMPVSHTNCAIFSSATGVFSWLSEMIIRAMGR